MTPTARRPWAAIVLAAGASSRLGRPKQLEPFGGSTLLRHAVDTATNVADHVVVVTGAADVADAVPADPRVALTHNPDWSAGMGTSLRAGVAALPPDVAGTLVLTCDMPHVAADHLAALLAAATDHPAAADHAGRPGVPAAFPATWLPRLAALPPDAGAAKLLRSSADVTLIEVPTFDVDTPADAARLRS